MQPQPSVSFFALPTHEFKKKLRPWVIIATFALAALIALMPTPEGLSIEGQRAIAIFVLCLIFWLTNAIPLMITSLFAIILLPLLGVLDSKIAYSLFGNQAVFFILGAFMLASAMMQSGLSKRLSLTFLKYFKRNRFSLVVGLLLIPAGLSFVMSEHAVAALFFPIVLEIGAALHLQQYSRYGMALMLAVTWGCIIGGIATFLGGARALLAVGILEETTGETISFLPWMLAALPTVILMLFVAAGVLFFLMRKEKQSTTEAQTYIEHAVSELGPMSRREQSIGLLMLITIIAWVTVGHTFGLATIALAMVVVLFLFKLLSWKQVEKDVNWGIFLMYGGAITLGFALDSSGAALWITQLFTNDMVVSAGVLIAVCAILATLLTEGISNSAVIAVLLPIALALGGQYGISAQVVTLAVAIPAGLAFMLPISTPANALAASSPYVRSHDMLTTGVFLNTMGLLIFISVAFLYWPLIGFEF